MEMEMEKLDDPIILGRWIIYLFHFHIFFPRQIIDPNTAQEKVNNSNTTWESFWTMACDWND